ncbi:MAG: hypothetical protein HRU43_07055, partial [Simkaniaceae bacterium]|nr:hypothetical protein [Simkaniaceae bacterium]
FYAGIGVLAKEFEQYEQEIVGEGIFKNTISYKLDYVLPMMRDYIKGTKAYEKMMEQDFSKNKLRKKDLLKHNYDTYLISIDFKAANHSAMKTFDSDGELYGSWEELCIALDVHPMLAKSKSYRQMVFGNTNPKRLGKIQHTNILIIVDKLIEDHDFEEDDFVFISEDEMVVRLRPDHKHAIGRIHVLNAAVGTIIQNEGIGMQTHYKVFKNEAITKEGMKLKDMCVQTRYNVKMGGLSEKSTSLFKVPGHKFFKYFKTHILKEEFDQRDLMFMSDGEIAVWAEDDDSISEILIPEGEMSFDEVMKDYPYLVKKLQEGVPGTSDAQIRKMVNIFLDTCGACHNAESGCHCWNDE